MCVRVLSKYTRVVKQSNSVSLETPTTSSEVACKKKLAREFGLPHFLLFPQIRNLRKPCLIGYLCGSSPHEKDNT